MPEFPPHIPDTPASPEEERRAALETTANRQLAAMAARLKDAPLAWRQELPITGSLDAATALSQIEMAGKGVRSAQIALWLSCLAAMLAALLLAIGLAIKIRSWPKLQRIKGAAVAAMHAEDVNRTRHIRASLDARSSGDTKVLIVGRPHLAPAQTQALLRDSGWDGGFALVWSFGSLLGALPRGTRICLAGPAAMRQAGYCPTFAQITAIMLRVFIGAASARRWRTSGSSARQAVFGHTGRADTAMLEEEMQRQGTPTVHWMHGVSTGMNFNGVSDLCVTLCSHDARWHSELLDYRKNVAFPLPKPVFRTGIRPGWVVMTNMTHPAYPYFPIIGCAHEMRLIETIEQLAKKADVAPGEVTWKPHPVFYQQDPETRALVSKRIEKAGFALWPDAAMPFDLAADHEVVITTPSGVALDLLKTGRLPVMAAFHPIDPGHVLARIEPMGNDADSLKRAIDIASDSARAKQLFDRLWSEIEPGEYGSLDQIEAELPRDKPNY
ncbi:MAG: hypothetical protein AAGK02_08820 [Pseudomonadota bacterium]